MKTLGKVGISMYAPLNVNKLQIRNPANPEIPFGSTVRLQVPCETFGQPTTSMESSVESDM